MVPMFVTIVLSIIMLAGILGGESLISLLKKGITLLFRRTRILLLNQDMVGWKINEVRRGLKLSLKEKTDGKEIYEGSILSFSCTVLYEKDFFETHFQFLNISLTKILGNIFSECISIKKRQETHMPVSVTPDSINTGDPDFDILAEVTGRNRTEISAYFDARLRSTIIRLIKKCYNIVISPTHIAIIISFNNFLNWQDLYESIIQPAIEAALSLGKTINIQEHLIGNALHDPVPKIQIRSIEALLHDYGIESDIIETLTHCLTDPAPEVANYAYDSLGVDRIEHVKELLQKQWQTRFLSIEEESRLYAFIGTTKERQFSPLLIRGYKEVTSAGIKPVIIRAIGMLGQVSATSFLLPLIEDPDFDIKRAAVYASGLCGNRSVIPKITSIIGNTVNQELKNAAIKALTLLTDRFGNIESGLLSLSTDFSAEGGLSEAETTETGGLSITGEDGTRDT